jgi:hypothetical protein
MQFKFFKYMTGAAAALLLLASCEKKDYPVGLPEYEHHYYLAYLPNNNTQVNVQRTQTALLKFPVQFYSAYTRNYDAVGQYQIVTDGIANPAVAGQDFNIVDKDGNAIQPVDGKYSFTFAKAERRTDTIYVKMLNNPTPGTRKMEVQIVENKTNDYYVDIFSTAFRRPVEIR